MEEEGISKDREKAEKVIGKVFKTTTGKKLAEKLYLNASVSVGCDP
jgi:hypothetical protein